MTNDQISIHNGDCLDVMRQMPDNFVDTIITDPPYGLRFMGKDWDHGLPGIAYWREALRIAKPGATLMAFGGSRTYHRLVCAIEDAGWEIRDCISYFSDGTQQERAFMASLDDEQLAAYLELHYPSSQMAWVYGQGMGLGLNVSKAIDKAAGEEREVVGEVIRLGDKKPYPRNQDKDNQNDYVLGNGNGPYDNMGQITSPSAPLAKTFDGWNSRLKPAFEPIVVAMKPLDGTYAENAERWGVAGYWLDGGRVGTGDIWNGNKSNAHNNYSADVYGKFNEQYAKPSHPKGRFPANLIHSNEPGVLREFDKAGVSASNARPNIYGNIYSKDANIYGKFNPGVYRSILDDKGGTPSRYFAQCPPDGPARFTYYPKASSKERGNGNNHPTVKPLSLLRYLCRLTRTPYGGLVLDPFAGSGTTGLAARVESRPCILIEKEAKYCEIIANRLAGEDYVGPDEDAPATPSPAQMKLF